MFSIRLSELKYRCPMTGVIGGKNQKSTKTDSYLSPIMEHVIVIDHGSGGGYSYQ